MYTIHHLNNAFTALIYQPLTYPLFRPRLQSLKPQDSTVAIAASDSGKPIGLAVAEIQRSFEKHTSSVGDSGIVIAAPTIEFS